MPLQLLIPQLFPFLYSHSLSLPFSFSLSLSFLLSRPPSGTGIVNLPNYLDDACLSTEWNEGGGGSSCCSNCSGFSGNGSCSDLTKPVLWHQLNLIPGNWLKQFVISWYLGELLNGSFTSSLLFVAHNPELLLVTDNLKMLLTESQSLYLWINKLGDF